MQLRKLQPIHFILLLTFVAAFLRFYNLRGTLQFLGDQGRDALVYHRLLIERDPVFIGPVTSVGNMYLGPAFYYLTLPFYAITYPDPIGPVMATAMLGTLTVPLMYLLGKDLIGKSAALWAAALYTFSWTFIELTRFSWNPNPAPLFSLIMIWATYRALTKHPKYWLLVSLSFSVLLQLHYLILLAAVSAAGCWLWAGYQHLRNREQLKEFVLSTLGSAVIFVLSLFPLLLFDLKNNFINLRAFTELIFGEQEHIRGARKLVDILKETHGRALHILWETTLWKLRDLSTVLLALVGLVWGVSVTRKSAQRTELAILLWWLVIGVVGTAFYSSTVFDHYIAYLFPVTALLLGYALAFFWRTTWLKPVVAGAFGVFLFFNVQKYQFTSKGWTIDEMKMTSDEIVKHLGPGETYEVVLLASHRDIEAMNYRYFLTVSDHPPVKPGEFAQADALVIINEEKKESRVVDLPIYQIVTFPNKNVSEVFRIQDGPEVTILRR